MKMCPGMLKARVKSHVEHTIVMKFSADDLEKFRVDPSGTYKLTAELDPKQYDPSRHYYNCIEANGMTFMIKGIDRDDENKLVFTVKRSSDPAHFVKDIRDFE